VAWVAGSFAVKRTSLPSGLLWLKSKFDCERRTSKGKFETEPMTLAPEEDVLSLSKLQYVQAEKSPALAERAEKRQRAKKKFDLFTGSLSNENASPWCPFPNVTILHHGHP